MLSSYKTILWDFDGVILDSDRVRSLGFATVLSTYPKDEVDRLLAYHSKNGGLSRYVKFRHFFEVIRGETVTEQEIQDLAQQFSVIMMQFLKNPDLLIMDCVNFLEAWQSQAAMHVVSGSDQTELRQLCSALNVGQYFISIHGSPTPKKELVKNLLERHDYDLPLTCLIGDSINDYEAAEENGIDFFGYNNPSLSTLGKGYIERFSDVAIISN